MILINTDNFGTVLRELRQKKGLTQEELARGICSRQYIYLVETGKRMLSAYALQLVSFKLGVDLSKYVLLSSYEDPIHIEKTMSEMDLLRRNRNFSELYEHVNRLEREHTMKDLIVYQYLQWNKGICQCEVDNEPDRALTTFLTAVKMTRKDFIFDGPYDYLKTECITKTEFSLYSSIARILYQKGNIQDAITLILNLKCNLETHIHDYESETIYSSILYNLALYLTIIGNYNEALKYAELLIELCNRRNQLFLLGEGMYQKSVILFHLDEKKAAEQMARDALSFFRLRGHKEYVNIISREIEEQYG